MGQRCARRGSATAVVADGRYGGAEAASSALHLGDVASTGARLAGSSLADELVLAVLIGAPLVLACALLCCCCSCMCRGEPRSARRTRSAARPASRAGAKAASPPGLPVRRGGSAVFGRGRPAARVVRYERCCGDDDE